MSVENKFRLSASRLKNTSVNELYSWHVLEENSWNITYLSLSVEQNSIFRENKILLYREYHKILALLPLSFFNQSLTCMLQEKPWRLKSYTHILCVEFSSI